MNKKNLAFLGIFLINMSSFSTFATTPIHSQKRGHVKHPVHPLMLIKRSRIFDIENKTNVDIRLVLRFSDQSIAQYDVEPGKHLNIKGDFAGIIGYQLYAKETSGEYDEKEAKNRINLLERHYSFTIEAEQNKQVFMVIIS